MEHKRMIRGAAEVALDVIQIASPADEYLQLVRTKLLVLAAFSLEREIRRLLHLLDDGDMLVDHRLELGGDLLGNMLEIRLIELAVIPQGRRSCDNAPFRQGRLDSLF